MSTTVASGSDDYKPILLKPLKDQIGCIYAALLLNGDGDSKVEITSDKLLNILRAAKLEPNPFFPNLYAKVLASVDLNELILSGLGGSGSAGPVSTSTSTTSAPTETKVEEKKEEPKKEEKEEESASIGGLFGSDDD